MKYLPRILPAMLFFVLLAGCGEAAEIPPETAALSPSAQGLLDFIYDIEGEYILSGQYSDLGVSSQEAAAVYSVTGQYPAVFGFDLMDYSPSRVDRGTVGVSVEHAVDWHEMGGIVTFCWHWNAPKELYDTEEQPWYRGFYTEATGFDFAKALSGEDAEGYDLLIRDIDAAAAELMTLKERNIPVLWRPLHEASGGWFWWGAQGAEAYTALWTLMYTRMTEHHGLDNLVWVWNGQDADWYPGDGMVHLIGEDIYGEKQVYSAYAEEYQAALKYSKNKKPIGLTEVGSVPDIDKMFESEAAYFMFALWEGPFVINENGDYSDEYTHRDEIKKAYNHNRVITLDKLREMYGVLG